MRFFSILWKILVLAGLIAGGVWFVQQRMIPVANVAPVERGTAVDAVPGSVEVEAELVQNLRSEIGGRIQESFLSEGREVSRGEVLVQMDTEPLELDIERIQTRMANVERRKERGSLLKFELLSLDEDIENLEKLVQEGSAPSIDLERMKRERESIQEKMEREELEFVESLRELEIELLQKERQINQATVRSPMDGIIEQVYAFPGDLIGSGAPLARIISVERRVEAKISEENRAGIEVGQAATVRFLSYPRELFDARVVRVMPSVDADTQRYRIHLDVDIDIDLLLPGLSGEVSIIRGSRSDTLLIPRRAMLGQFIFVLGPEQVVERRRVEPGFVSLNQAEVLSGVEEGELIITDNLDLFRDGDRVRVNRID